MRIYWTITFFVLQVISNFPFISVMWKKAWNRLLLYQLFCKCICALSVHIVRFNLVLFSSSFSLCSGDGRVWSLKAVTPVSSSLTQIQLRPFRSWRDTKPMWSRWVLNVFFRLSHIVHLTQYKRWITDVCFSWLICWNSDKIFTIREIVNHGNKNHCKRLSTPLTV